MNEQSTTLGHMLSALFVAAAGYVSGDYVTIIFGAVAGSVWPLSSADTKTRTHSAILLFKLVMTACALTGFVAYLLEHYQAVPAAQALAPIAFGIAVVGDRWVRIIDAVVKALLTLVEAIGKTLTDRISKLLGGDRDA